MKEKAMFDTNILVYAYDVSDPEKREKCKRLVEEVFSGERLGVVSNQILGELFVVLTEEIRNPLSAEEAGLIVDGIIESKNWAKVNYNSETVKRAIETSKKLNIHFWDTVIGETMLENNIFVIFTENEKDFNKIPKIKVINPLKV
jgi:predicted nucleic acid-binding protein